MSYLLRLSVQFAFGLAIRVIANRGIRDSRALRRTSEGPHRHSHCASAAALALLPPATALLARAGAGPAAVRVPATGAGRVGLAVVALGGAGIEELLWRGPLTYAARGTIKLAVAAVAVPGFAISHLPRDSVRWLPLHAANAAAWSCAASLHRSIAWPWLAHAGYNAALFVLAPRQPR